ncbi:MAG TPA: hypothetical protein VF627_13520 [Abditibacterium sp.]|jgi:hypothetical protein
MTPLLSDLSSYTYGTTRLGDASIRFDHRVAVARAAMSAGIGFHTSHTYDDALQVLGVAFEQDPSQIPPAIFKIGWDSIEQIREVIALNLEPIGQKSMAIGQLCLGSELAEDFASGGPSLDGFRALKAEGLVGRFVLEVWPWNSDFAVKALRNGHFEGVVDGAIFYLNPLQRFVSDELWDLLHETQTSIVAMRTVCGGSVTKLRDSESAPDYLKKRAAQVAPLFEKSGYASWTQFCLDFAASFPLVKTTVGSTSHPARLQEFLDASAQAKPLPGELHEEILSLQREWAFNHDRFAAPWSM